MTWHSCCEEQYTQFKIKVAKIDALWDQNGQKTIPFAAAHIYLTQKGITASPPPPPPPPHPRRIMSRRKNIVICIII